MKSFKEKFAEIKRICESGEFKREIERTKQLLSARPLVLFGAGTVGVSASAVLKHYGINATCFCDKNKKGIQNETGLPIIPPQTLIKEYPDANIVICSVNYADEIKRDLNLLGVTSEKIFSRTFLNLHEMTLSDVEPHLCGYERAYDLFFKDNKSKQILLGRLRYYLTSSPLASSPITSQYFDPEILVLSDDEIFVDGGMYVGDTAEQFFERTQCQYRHYYGFEPDTENCGAASKNMVGKPNVTIIPKGLWSRETQLNFSGNLKSSSKLDDMGGGNFVDVIGLDVYFSDKTPPTFIKMDIEGAELEALKGAENIIRQYKPKLAICAYHKPEDIYTLPDILKSYHADYKFYLRHYTNSIYETVLYAI